MAIEQFVPFHPLWPVFVAHLHRVDAAQWVLESDSAPKAGHYFLGSVIDDQVIGHIAFRMQVIAFPAVDPAAGEVPLRARDGRPLRETFVQSFAVEPAHRRQGQGRALQLAALAMTKTLGCHQIRLWCPADNRASHALHVSMGFAAHPATQVLDDGRVVSGVYFVKTV